LTIGALYIPFSSDKRFLFQSHDFGSPLVMSRATHIITLYRNQYFVYDLTVLL
jgi:hypothetical protein